MFKKAIFMAVAAIGISLVIYSSPVSNTAANKQDKNARGRQLFVKYCASCHGTDGKGGGPAASSLKATLPDLTMIPKQDGKFPALRVQRIISGADVVTGHGSREMPVWGEYFRTTYSDRLVSVGNVYALTKYIEHIQAQ